jgi:hypothetical protein
MTPGGFPNPCPLLLRRVEFKCRDEVQESKVLNIYMNETKEISFNSISMHEYKIEYK